MDDKALLLVTFLLAFSYEKAAAQELKTEAYACKVEFTGGLAYDADFKELAKHDISAERQICISFEIREAGEN